MQSTLLKLIESANNAQSGYGAAARDCTNSDLKHLFSQLSREHATFSTKLQSFLTPTDKPAAHSGETSGWIHLTSTQSDRNNLDVLNECERCEDQALHQYQDAIASLNLGVASDTVKHQSDRMVLAHRRVKSFRDKLQASTT